MQEGGAGEELEWGCQLGNWKKFKGRGMLVCGWGGGQASRPGREWAGHRLG